MTDTPTQRPNLADLDPAQMRFVDNYIPPLPPGNYDISVTQTLVASGASDVDTQQTRSQQFSVQGPRYTLNPDEVHRQFPAPSTQGNFAEALPQIVLNHRALPWERTVFDGDPQTPWLALIVLDADEILPPTIGTAATSGAGATGTTTITLAELLAPEAGTVAPAITLDAYDDPTTQCQVVDISPQVFKTVVPDQSILRYLTSVREINLIDRSVDGLDAVPASVKDLHLPDVERAFSVVSAHRFPDAADAGQPARQNIVHLVSIEGFADYLSAPSADFPSGTDRVRMVSLSSWSFSCLREPAQSFADLMEGLEPEGGDPAGLRLVLPHDPAPEGDDAAAYSAAALDAGYVPRAYQTRQGEQTFAWYRGPAVASLPQRQDVSQSRFANSAQAVVYDADKGLFDMSYGVAFETGRLMAMASQGFVNAVTTWQTKVHRAVDTLTARASYADLDTADLDTDDVAALWDAPRAAKSALQALAQGTLAQATAAISAPAHTPMQATAEDTPALTPQAALAHAAVRRALQNRFAPKLEVVADWLGKLWLLEGVPFNTLVPDAQMLPRESLRFFYLDAAWQSALLAGAFSVAAGSSRDHAVQDLFAGDIADMAQNAATTRRARQLGLAPDAIPTGTCAGMLLRSAVVSGWPGLEVKAFKGAGDGQRKDRITPLRLTRLAPNVLLALFPEVPDWVELDEPREGLHFGVESNNEVYLRALSGDSVGATLPGDPFVTASIDATTRILDIADLLTQLQDSLGEADPLGPADFALEMIKVPESMVFKTQSEA